MAGRGGSGEAETGLRLVAALWWFWMVRGHLREGRAWVEGLLALGAGAREWATRDGAQAARGECGRAPCSPAVRWPCGRASMRRRSLAGAGEGAGRGGGRPAHGGARANGLGILATHQGDLARAGARYAESLALMREAGDRRGIGRARNLGDAAVYQGDLERAAASYAEALALYRQVGDRGASPSPSATWGRWRGGGARWPRPRRSCARRWRSPGSWATRAGAPRGLEQLAATAGVAGQGARAARLLGAAAALREALGAPQPPQERTDTEQAVAPARAALGEEAWAAAYAAGRALTLEQAIAEALARAMP